MRSSAEEVKHRWIATHDVRLHVVEAGPDAGPLVLLLHGFPEFWYGWRHQIGALARAGYRVWAPDQRGYNLSEKPKGIAAYAIDRLADDVLSLIDAAGVEAAVVIGHDWGGAVAWWLGHSYEDRIRRLVVINMPEGRVMEEHLRHRLRQLLRSWYIFFFQIPWLPEGLTGVGRGTWMTRVLRQTSRPGAFTDEDVERYHGAWLQPGARRAMINWYRAALRMRTPARSDEPIDVPTLLIWGVLDRFLGVEMARPSIERCRRGRLAVIETATHWVHHEEPDRVNALILQFLAQSPITGTPSGA